MLQVQRALSTNPPPTPFIILDTFWKLILFLNITKTCLFKNIENFTFKNWKFSDKKKKKKKKKSDIFYISAQTMDCGVLVRTASTKRVPTIYGFEQ